MGQEDSRALTGIAHGISISTFFQLLRCASLFYFSLGDFIFNIVLPAIFITQHGSSEGHEMLKRSYKYHSIADDVPIPKM